MRPGRVTGDHGEHHAGGCPIVGGESSRHELTRAEFFATIADWPNALQAAQQALAANPALIRAHIVAGQAYEAQGNLQAARSAFLTAKQLFDQQHPNSYEAPKYLIVKIAELDARLGR